MLAFSLPPPYVTRRNVSVLLPLICNELCITFSWVLMLPLETYQTHLNTCAHTEVTERKERKIINKEVFTMSAVVSSCLSQDYFYKTILYSTTKRLNLNFHFTIATFSLVKCSVNCKSSYCWKLCDRTIS